MSEPSPVTPDPNSRRRFVSAQAVLILVALIGAAATVGAAWLTGKGQESETRQPGSFTQTVVNGLQIIGNIVTHQAAAPADGHRSTGAAVAAATASAPASAPASGPAGTAADLNAAPPTSAGIPLMAFPRYDDPAIRAYGMTSSVNKGGHSTVVPVRIENKLGKDLLIAYDAEGITTLTSDTGETNGNSGGCNVGGIRHAAAQQLARTLTAPTPTPTPPPTPTAAPADVASGASAVPAAPGVDPLQFSGVAAGASLTLQISCYLATADATKVGRVNVNVPLLRLDGGQLRRFTLNLDGIPVHKTAGTP